MVKRNVNNLICLLVAVCLFAVALFPSGQEYLAEETVEYTSASFNSSVRLAYQFSGSAFFTYEGQMLESDVFYIQYQYNLTDSSVNGNALLNVGLKLKLQGRVFENISCMYMNIYDSKWQTICSIQSVDFNMVNDQVCAVSVSDFDLGAHRDVHPKTVVFCLKVVCASNDSLDLVDDPRPYFLSPYIQYINPEKDYLEDVVKPTPEDQNKVDEFESEVGEQSSQLDDLVDDMNSLEKPDPDSFNTDLSDIVSDSDISAYSKVLSVITNSKLVLSYMTVLFTIGLVGYALFGKRG